MKHKLAHFYHVMHGLLHTSYFGLVFIEGYSVYASVAGILAIMTVVSLYLGEESE